jgi:hypothetical protein
VVSAQFRNTRQKPKKGVNERECLALAQELVGLIVTGSNILDSFRDVTRKSVDYAEYLPLLQNLQEGELDHPSGLFQREAEFYRHLEAACAGYAIEPKLWPDALGLIVEFTFLLLMRQKYPTAATAVYHEHSVEITVNTAVLATDPKSLDVIMWCSQAECGEFLEVKKQLGNKIRHVLAGNADDFVDKVVRMYHLLSLLSAGGVITSVVGLATLSRDALVGELITIILRNANLLGATVPLTSLPVQLTAITGDNTIEWYKSKVV